MTDIVISVGNVSKCYRVFDDQRSRLLNAVWPKLTNGMQEIWALKDINFEIKRGEAVAIIGRNGGGKSTLLEILTGTLTPTIGEVKVTGRVSALLELGSGFNPEYSGRDNVILNGLLLGLSKEDILSRFSEIEAFAEIGGAIDRPVKTYSSGMMMRLAFAVQVLCDPDILIIDEALSVGDFFFQQKCMSYIRGLCAKGVTLLFVSHDVGVVRDLCSRAVYLQSGCLAFNGEVNTAIQFYLTDKQSEGSQAIEIPTDMAQLISPIAVDAAPLISPIAVDAAPWGDATIWQRGAIGDKATQILAIVVEEISGNSTQVVRIGETLRFVVWYQADETAPVHVSVSLKNRYDQMVNCTSSYTLGISMPSSTARDVAVFAIELGMSLEAGQYSVMVSLGLIGDKPNQGVLLDETTWFGPLTVRWDYSTEVAPFLGMFGAPAYAVSPIIRHGGV